MKFSLMSLGDNIRDPVTGAAMNAAERHRMMIEAAVVADRTGLYGINIGEHHGIGYEFSAPPVLLAAIAERTKRLKLSTAVALAANLDAYRLAEDYATLDVISGGRVEIVTGRGNFFESTFTLFGQSVAEAADRYAEAMELLCTLWNGEPLQWEGRFRPRINGEALAPRPVQHSKRPFWIAGGSSRDTVELAGRLGLNLMLPSAFGRPDKFVAVVDIYLEAFAAAGHKREPVVGAGWHGWVARTTEEAHARFRPRYEAYHAFTKQIMLRVNSNPPPYLTNPFDYEWLTTHGAAIVGSPDFFAERLSKLHKMLGSEVNLMQMDMGGVPTGEYLDMVELFTSEVVPMLAGSRSIKGETGDSPAAAHAVG